MPELKDIITYILTVLNILVIGIFSYLLWRATVQSNKLSEAIIKTNKELEANIQAGLLKEVINQAEEVITALSPSEDKLLFATLPKIPLKCKLEPEELARLNEEERELIDKFWEIYRDYIKNYWIEPSGNFRKSFGGQGFKHAAQAAKKTKEELEDILEKLRA